MPLLDYHSATFLPLRKVHTSAFENHHFDGHHLSIPRMQPRDPKIRYHLVMS